MTLAILGTFFWGIAGPVLGSIGIITGFLYFAIAMDFTPRAPDKVKTWGRWAFAMWGLTLLWTIVWLFMTTISILNWISAAHS